MEWGWDQRWASRVVDYGVRSGVVGRIKGRINKGGFRGGIQTGVWGRIKGGMRKSEIKGRRRAGMKGELKVGIKSGQQGWRTRWGKGLGKWWLEGGS